MGDKPCFVFILGTTRSGKKLIRSLLDGHPDVLMWPFEFPFFTNFKEIAGTSRKVSISKINHGLILPKFQKHLIKDSDPSASFDFSVFQKEIEKRQDEEMDAISYLYYLFQALNSAHNDYMDNPVKYYAMICLGLSIDWNDHALIESAYFIFAYRDMIKSYASTRGKRLADNVSLYSFFNPKRGKNALYYMETFQLFSNIIKDHLHKRNFHIVPLNQMQQNPDKTLTNICKFLLIEDHPALSHLTVLGQPYKGNMQEKGLNQGKISPRPSKLMTPLCSFEKRIFDLLDLFSYESEKMIFSKKFGFIEMVRSAFSSAFIEIPDDKLTSKKNTRKIVILCRRSLILIYFFVIYCVIRNVPFSKLLKYKEDLYIRAVKDPNFWITKNQSVIRE